MAIDLVTGASGLVGSNLVRTLISNGRRVRILTRSASRTAHLDDLQDLERVEGDILDDTSLEKALAGVEDVYHCAALVSMSERQRAALWQTNVEGTQNVIEAVKRCGSRRLIHCSSVDAIGLSFDHSPASEETVWNWDVLGIETAYARSKYEAQRRVLAAARAEIDAVVVCPTYMLGAYDTRPSSGKMILSVARQPLLAYPSGGNNFIDVEDVARGMLRAAQVGRRGEVYILGNQNLTYRALFALIAERLQRPAPVLPIPYPLACLAGWWGDLQELMIRRESDLNSSTARLGYIYHYYDPSKAVRELGLEQSPIETAVTKAIAWFRRTGMLPEPSRPRTLHFFSRVLQQTKGDLL